MCLYQKISQAQWAHSSAVLRQRAWQVEPARRCRTLCSRWWKSSLRLTLTLLCLDPWNCRILLSSFANGSRYWRQKWRHCQSESPLAALRVAHDSKNCSIVKHILALTQGSQSFWCCRPLPNITYSCTPKAQLTVTFKDWTITKKIHT